MHFLRDFHCIHFNTQPVFRFVITLAYNFGQIFGGIVVVVCIFHFHLKLCDGYDSDTLTQFQFGIQMAAFWFCVIVSVIVRGGGGTCYRFIYCYRFRCVSKGTLSQALHHPHIQVLALCECVAVVC